MITPRYYEDRIKEIQTELPKDQQDKYIRQLMIDTLDSLGYPNSLLKGEDNAESK